MTSLAAAGASPHRRAAAVYLAVMAALVLAWLVANWQWYDTWRDGRSFGAALLAPLVLLVLTQGTYWWLLSRTRPVALQVHDGAFVALAAHHLSASSAATLLALGAVSSRSFLPPLSAEMPRDLLVLGRACLALLLPMFLLLVAAFARRTGQILLRPEGLRITYPYGTRDVPWDAISAGPPRSGSLLEPTVRIGRPDLVRSTGLARRLPRKALLPTTSTWIRREFLLDAVNYYLATPAARPTIGTDEGYVHLRRVLRAG